jgi:hypothetical protein
MRKGLVALLGFASCGGGGSHGGALPDVAALARNVVPQLSTTTLSAASLRPQSLPYNGTPSDFTSVASWLGEILGPDDGGVDTKIMIQLDRMRSIITKVNSTNFDSQGKVTGCDKTLTSSSTVNTPFFGSNPTPIFWASKVNEQGKYQCYVKQGASGGFVFGKAPYANPAVMCSDANEYFVMNGENISTVNPGPGGSTPTAAYEFQKIYYNGCTGDIGLAMSLTTQYGSKSCTNDCEFDARLELWGNAPERTFQLRVLKLDGGNGAPVGGFPISFGQFQGAGVASVAGGTTSNLTMSYARVSCTSASSCSASPSPPYLWCLTVTQAVGANAFAFGVATTSADCAAWEYGYRALSSLVLADVTRTNIDFSATPGPFGF